MYSAVTCRIQTYLFAKGIIEWKVKKTKKARTKKEFPIGHHINQT